MNKKFFKNFQHEHQPIVLIKYQGLFGLTNFERKKIIIFGKLVCLNWKKIYWDRKQISIIWDPMKIPLQMILQQNLQRNARKGK